MFMLKQVVKHIATVNAIGNVQDCMGWTIANLQSKVLFMRLNKKCNEMSLSFLQGVATVSFPGHTKRFSRIA